MKNGQNRKVIIAMSGGVDSSVAAALLKKDGFDVIGAFMKFWSEPDKKGMCIANRCCSPESEKRARLVCKKLNIPFYVFNFEKEFKKKVVDYFIKESKAGLTPNPCVVCNKEIKFKLLFKKLLSLNADYIATGHYARIDNHKLLKGKDKGKDQSYFLWKLDKKVLKHVLFPIGDYRKDKVKKLAKKFDLPVIDIPESQEICFVQKTIADFLKRYIKVKPGNIVDTKGNILAKHQGLWFYTIGQRKGIELSGGPYYVLDKNTKKNLLILTKKERDLYKKELRFKNANWLSKVSFPLKAKARIRYGHKTALVMVDKGKAVFSRNQRAITPGQSVVFYNNKEVLGGGIIK